MFATLLALAATPFPALAAPPPAPEREVLVLLQETAQAPFFASFLQALNEELAAAGDRAILRVEALPSGLSPTNAAQWFDPRVAGRQADAVVAFGAGPLAFSLQARQRLWEQMPIVFAGLAPSEQPVWAGERDVTGTYVPDTSGPTLALGFKLFPRTRHIALIGTSASHDPFRPGLADALAAWPGRVDLLDLSGATMAELRDRVATLPPDTLVLLAGPAIDRTGRWLFPRRLMAELQPLTQAPIVSDVAAVLGRGIVGGAMLDAAELGRSAARQLHSVLEAGSTAALVPDTLPSPPLRVDGPALLRHRVPESLLPEDAEIVNRPPTLWQAYRPQVTLAVLVLLLQSALVAWLVVERRQRRRAELHAHQRLAELAHLNRVGAVCQLSLTLAHELNQPLGAILSQAQTGELLLDRAAPPLAELRALLGRIVQATQRAGRVVRSLRQLTQKVVPVPQRLQLDGWVQETATLLAPEAARRRVELRLSLGAGAAASVMGDAVQLQQVLINLVLNAMDAMAALPRRESAFPVVTILTACQGAGLASVRVEDAGPGLPPQDEERVFTAFYSTKPDGLGLGLGIARELATAHGGSLTARNRQDGGACFELCLPILPLPGVHDAQTSQDRVEMRFAR